MDVRISRALGTNLTPLPQSYSEGLAAPEVRAVPPSGSVTSYTSPTWLPSGGWLITSVGPPNPSTRQRHPRSSDSSPKPGACLSLSPALGAQLAVSRVIVIYSRTSGQQRKRAVEASSP
jgi:hypothetical protein